MNPPRIQLLVFEALQAHAGADFVSRLVEAFAEEAPTLVAQLQRAAAAGDAETFENTAHSLKSNGLAFGATRLAALAGRLEGQGLAVGGDAIAELSAELTALVPGLRALARH